MVTKEIQGKFWSTAPHYWAKHFEPFFLPMYKKALEQIKLNKDSILLDAGCGSGLFSRMAAATGAGVVGVDAAPGLLKLARERAPENSFLEEDLESLPFASNRFDVVTGFNSFQFAGSFSGALSEAKRVLKNKGRLVIGIWDKPEYSDATNIINAISSLLPPPLPGTPGPFALSENGKIEKVCDSMGMKMIYKTKVTCPFLYSSLNDSIKSFMGTGPAAAALNHAPESLVEETIATAMAAYHLAEDMYYLQNSFLIYIAEK